VRALGASAGDAQPPRLPRSAEQFCAASGAAHPTAAAQAAVAPAAQLAKLRGRAGSTGRTAQLAVAPRSYGSGLGRWQHARSGRRLVDGSAPEAAGHCKIPPKAQWQRMLMLAV